MVDTVASCGWYLGFSPSGTELHGALRAQLDFQEDRITSDALRALAIRNVTSLNALHANAHAAGWPELAAVPSVLVPAFERAQQDLAMTWRAEPGLPKRSLFNFYFTRVSIDGMTILFLETLANQSLLPFDGAATVRMSGAICRLRDESEGIS